MKECPFFFDVLFVPSGALWRKPGTPGTHGAIGADGLTVGDENRQIKGNGRCSPRLRLTLPRLTRSAVTLLPSPRWGSVQKPDRLRLSGTHLLIIT